MAGVEPMDEPERNEKLPSTLLWTIEKISYWEPEHCENIQSPSYIFNNIGGCELRLCLKGEEKKNTQFACRLRFAEKISSLDYEWSLLNGNGSPVVTRMQRNAMFDSYVYVDLIDWPTSEDVFIVKGNSFLTNDTLFLRCRFWKSDTNFKKAEYISGYTRIRTAEKSFIWRIRNFTSLQLDQELITPFLLSLSTSKINFKLKLSLKGQSLTDAETRFEIILESGEWHIITTNIFLLDLKGKIMKSLKAKNAFNRYTPPSQEVKYLPKFVSRQEILDRKSDWLHGDDLALLCHFQTVMENIENGIVKSCNGFENIKTEISRINHSVPKTAIIETKITDPTCATSNVPEESSQFPTHCSDGSWIPQHKTKSAATLQEYLLSLYTRHTRSDFVLRSEDALFHVHKMVLIAKSPVFKYLLSEETKDASSDSLHIPDLDVDTLNWMLTFMYTGNFAQLEWESAKKLYYAADRYQVQTLKEECLHLLQSGINVQNVCDILELADRHQDKELEHFIHDFLIKHIDELIWSGEWEKFMKRKCMLAGNAIVYVFKKRLMRDCK